MSIVRHVGLKAVNGPLIVLDNIKNASFDELVKIHVENSTTRQGKIVQIDGERVVVQVFEGTQNLSLENTKIHFI